MKLEKWFDRKFDFESTQSIFPAVLERLRGTPARLEEKCLLVSADILTKRINGTWTIKENIGHLSDLESLWVILKKHRLQVCRLNVLLFICDAAGISNK